MLWDKTLWLHFASFLLFSLSQNHWCLDIYWRYIFIYKIYFTYILRSLIILIIFIWLYEVYKASLKNKSGANLFASTVLLKQNLIRRPRFLVVTQFYFACKHICQCSLACSVCKCAPVCVFDITFYFYFILLHFLFIDVHVNSQSQFLIVIRISLCY